MIVRALSFYIYIENAHATPPHLDVFLDTGAMGRCKVLCALCFWAPELVAAWLGSGSCSGRFCPPGVNFVSPGATFWVLRVALGWAGGPRSASLRKVWKNTKNEATWELNWEPFGTHFETAASKNRADERFVALLCQSFFEGVFHSVPKRVFRGNCWVQEASNVCLRQ